MPARENKMVASMVQFGLRLSNRQLVDCRLPIKLAHLPFLSNYRPLGYLVVELCFVLFEAI